MDIWCGEESAAQKLYALEAKGPPENWKSVYDAKSSAFKELDLGWVYAPPIAQVAGNVAVIKVAGSLIAGQAGWKRLMGYTGYEDVKAAVVESIGMPEIQGILMYVDSPGGSVNTLMGTAKLIREVSKAKPVVTFAATAASAGYWLASSAQYIVAEETNMIGSIGTIMQMVDATAANEKDGLKFNIFKSGSLKMAGNPNEELSPQAAAYFQQLVDDLTAIFYQNVSQYRNMNMLKLRADFGDGRAVLGARALAGGLIDELGGMGAAMKKLQMLIASKGM